MSHLCHLQLMEKLALQSLMVLKAYWLCKWRRASALSQRRKTWPAARWTPPGEDTAPAWCPMFERLRNGFTAWANRWWEKAMWRWNHTAMHFVNLLDSAPDDGLEFGVLFFSRSRASCSMFSDLQHVRQYDQSNSYDTLKFAEFWMLIWLRLASESIEAACICF